MSRKVGAGTTRSETRCGCFLPDLTGLARATYRPNDLRAPPDMTGWRHRPPTPRRKQDQRPCMFAHRPRHPDGQGVERLVEPDLAGEPRGAGRGGGEVEHVLLRLGRRRQLREILGIDDDMAGRAGHRALAGAFERLAIGLGDVEQPLPTGASTSRDGLAVGRDEADPGHAAKRRWRATASLSMRAASISCLAGVAAKAEADARPRLALAQAERGEHMARAARSAGAGRAGGKGEAAQLGDQAGGVEPVLAEVEIARPARLGRAIERPASPSAARKRRGQRAIWRAILGPARRASAAAAPKPAQSAGASVPERRPPSCPPPWSSGAGVEAVAQPQRADPLRPVDLVRRDRDQVAGIDGTAIRP